MKKVLFRGCGTAIATPFTEDNINLTEFAKLVEYQINEGIDAIIVCGTTGESSTMTLEEKKTLIKFSVELIDKRVPLIVGAGSNNTATSIEMSQYAESVGADGLLLVTPYYNKTTQEGLIHHYNSIANKTTLPIILYNVPSRTGLNILPETCLELSKTENIVAIKEASGNISQIAKIAALCGNNLSIYSGNDDQNIPILSLGGIVNSASIRIAGNAFDNDIVKYIKNKYKLLVGERTAEDIKISIGTVFPGSRNEKMEVRGRDLVTGLPHTITLTSDEVEEALRESVYTIIHAVKGILEQTPPELSADIIDKGIVLTGGGALVDGFAQILSQELKVPVFIAESPLTCVAEGTGILLDNLYMLERQ